MVRVKRQRNSLRSSNIKSRRKLSLTDSILSDHLEEFDQTNTPISKIENFSNEIFYEIFDYLDGYDIYKAFSNLNIHFEDLFLNSSFLMKINFSLKTVLDHRYQQFIKFNKYHILSFHSSNELFLEKFISLCIIDSSFHRLESFIFDEISPFKLLVYLFHLKTLPRLFSLTIRLNECEDDLGDIYQILFRFPVLKYLKLEILDEQEVDITIPIANEGQFSPIEHFIIHFMCTLNELADLLSYTPWLTHLSCSNIVESDEILKSEVLMKLKNLVHLNIGIIDIDIEGFEEFLLNFCSSLKLLNISIQSSDKNYLDGDRWERFILQKMPSLTKFIFCYDDTIYDDFQTNPYHSLINRFKSPFWIERRWLLRILVSNHEIQYTIRPSLYEFEEGIDLPMIPNSSFDWLSGTYLDLNSRHFPFKKNPLFLNKINSLFQTIDITRLNVECRQIPADILINILNLLPNLDIIQLSELPFYEDIYKCDLDINSINQFLKNNKITKLTLRNISNFEQINLIINFFPRLQYFTLQNLVNIDLKLAVKRTLLKIKVNKIFHPMVLCIFAGEAEYDKLEELKEMIDSKNLLKNFTIHRRFNRFDIQWK